MKTYSRRRSGIFLLSVVVGSSLLVMGGGLLLADHLFDLDKQQALIASRPFFATEAFIIRELRREAEAQIRKRDDAIARYLSQIERLEEREESIRSDFAAERGRLEEEVRRRLQAESGGAFTEEMVQERIASFVQDQERELAEALEGFQRERSEAARLLEEENQRRNKLAEELDRMDDSFAEVEAPAAATAVALPSVPAGPVVDPSIVEALQATVRRLEDELRRCQQVSPEEPLPQRTSAAALEAERLRGEEEISDAVLELISALESGRTSELPESLAGRRQLALIQDALEELLDPYRVVDSRSFRRIASISLVGSSEISAELIGGGRPPVGAAVEIRRRLDNNRELRVARGMVTSVAGERITIGVETLFSPDARPQVLDVVYLEE